MTADETQNALLNVGGTQNAIDLANALEAGRFHHVSSIAAAGELQGPVQRGHVRRGPEAPDPYHRTKFESEKLVRERVAGRRGASTAPSIVVGHSQTGEMDKIDGPYYFFKAIQKLRHALPRVVPADRRSSSGDTNIVPVDFVADAMDHIAHQHGLDGQAFHLVDPKPPQVGRRAERVRRTPRTRRTRSCASTSSSPTCCRRASSRTR